MLREQSYQGRWDKAYTANEGTWGAKEPEKPEESENSEQGNNLNTHKEGVDTPDDDKYDTFPDDAEYPDVHQRSIRV